MNRTSCPACGSTKYKKSFLALLAPWVRQLGSVSRRSTKYFICSSCGSGWVDLVYSDANITRIYTDYRGDKYFKTRNKWEKRYTKKFNYEIDKDPEIMLLRRKSLNSFLDSHVPSILSSTQIIVDVGGGHGGLMPDWPGIKEKYVMDISGVEPDIGVQKVDGWMDLPENHIDLVLAFGILEHLNSPLEFLNQMHDNISEQNGDGPEKTFVLIEVPKGVPERSNNFLFSIFYLASFSPFFWNILDNRLLNSSKFRGPIRIAEHLQFFTSVGLTDLASRAGFQVLATDSEEYSNIYSIDNPLRFSETIKILLEHKD